MMFSNLAPLDAIQDAVTNHKYATSWLIQSLDDTFVQSFLTWFFCRSSCGACPACKMIHDNIHPDVLIRDTSTISDVHLATDFLQTAPTISHDKIVIFTDADSLTINASNALLKTSEELVDNKMIILLTSSIYSIAKTLRSRCQILIAPYSKNDSKYNQVLIKYLETYDSSLILNLNLKDRHIISHLIGSVASIINMFYLRHLSTNINASSLFKIYDQLISLNAKICNGYTPNLELTLPLIFDYDRTKPKQNIINNH